MNFLKVSSLGDSAEKWIQSVGLFLYMNFLITWFATGYAVLIILAIFFPTFRYILLVYAAWIYYDRESGILGERRSHWVRNWAFWKYHNEYFPAKLHKTADLPADRNYLICAFPHGILCTGTFCAYGNDYGKFPETFPGLTSWITTLEQHFSFPLLREYCHYIGALPASAKCLNYFLGQKKGVALVLMVGGAQESFYTSPGVYKVNIKKRKGFVRIAYKTGASLVPSISFGEPEIYKQIHFSDNSIFKKIQVFLKKATGVAPLIFHGQFGLLPWRKPLNVVVGKPIEVEKLEEPTQEQIDNLHAKFIDALENLFESEKHKYIENADNTNLIIT